MEPFFAAFDTNVLMLENYGNTLNGSMVQSLATICIQKNAPFSHLPVTPTLRVR